MRDGTVLFFDLHNGDGDFNEDRRMVLADARTGEHRWTLPESGELRGGGLVWDSLSRPVLVAHSTGVAVLLVNCVAWTDDDHTVLVTVQPGVGLAPIQDLRQLRVLAFDVGTGAKRWETHGGWPLRIAGEVVLGVVGEVAPRGQGDFAAPVAGNKGKVTALDLATGRKRWDFADPAGRSSLVAVAGNAALVFGYDQIGYDGVRQVVDVRTGRELAEFRDVWYSGDCAGSIDTTLLACVTRDGRAIRTFDSTDHSTAVTVGDLGDGRDGIAADTVWRDRILDGSTEDAPSTFDRAGNRIDTKLPGVIIASSGDLVLAADVAYHDGSMRHEVSGVAVYQLSR